MSAASLQAQASSLGIPMTIPIDDGLRYEECDAHLATLKSIEGTKAVYQGQCNMGHNYMQDFEIEELQQMVHVENGELVYGVDKGYQAQNLEEM
jgi:hypothetical protein